MSLFRIPDGWRSCQKLLVLLVNQTLKIGGAKIHGKGYIIVLSNYYRISEFLGDSTNRRVEKGSWWSFLRKSGLAHRVAVVGAPIPFFFIGILESFPCRLRMPTKTSLCPGKAVSGCGMTGLSTPKPWLTCLRGKGYVDLVSELKSRRKNLIRIPANHSCPPC